MSELPISGHGEQEAREAFEQWKLKKSNSKLQSWKSWFYDQCAKARSALDRLLSRGKTEHQQSVEAMMRKIGQNLPNRPTLPDTNTCKLRATLVLEEALELIDALGYRICVPAAKFSDYQDKLISQLDSVQLQPGSRANLIEVAKESADLSVVVTGTLSAFGINDRAVLRAVDRNNMAKFGPGGYLDENGKWQKPPHHPKPDIAPILRAQGWEGPSASVGGN